MNPNFSPADSLLSAPSEYSQSLFGNDGTITPADMALTPQSIKMESDCAEATPTPSPEEQGDDKRPAKKRKSWGQELPTPKTNLPPRKRAKTEDEKEQRRIERVLRNRAAAQSSRERKRQEVEKLEIEKVKIEKENQLLVHRLRQAESDRFLLEEKVARMEAEMAAFRKILQGDAGAVEIKPKASSPTLSADLLSRPEEPVPNLKHEIEELDMILAPQGTVDPRTSLSSASSTEPTATTPGMTQHPAVSVRSRPAPMGLDDGSAASTDNLLLHSHDPQSDSLAQYDFSHFFDHTSARPDFSLFEDGMPAQPQLDGQQQPSFPFVSLVDLDAGQSLTIDHDFETFGSTDFSDQLAATTSGLQPSFGAPLIGGRDGQGIAAEI